MKYKIIDVDGKIREVKPLFEKCEICGKYKDIDCMIMVANRGRTVRHYCYDCYLNTTKKEKKS